MSNGEANFMQEERLDSHMATLPLAHQNLLLVFCFLDDLVPVLTWKHCFRIVPTGLFLAHFSMLKSAVSFTLSVCLFVHKYGKG